MNDISVLHLFSNIQFGVQEHCLEMKLNWDIRQKAKASTKIVLRETEDRETVN